jgi:DNA polymerase-1
MMGGMRRPGLFLIDSFGFIFRAYHARARSGAPPMRTQSGLSTEAVYIFHNMLRKLVATYSPDHIAAVFESTEPTFREQEFPEYKANRPETPQDLTEQIPYVRRMLEAMRIPVLASPGYEADDVIGTMAGKAAAAGVDVVIVSSDKDMLQLVNDHVSVLNPAKGDLWHDPEKVTETMGVAPSQVPDLLALKGDAVDNIPGAPGIGDKGAKSLIRRFGSVEAAIDRAAEVERKSYRESLQNNRDQIQLSKRLATIVTAVPVDWNLETLAARAPDPPQLQDLYRELEFFSLIKEGGPAGETQPRQRDYRGLDSAVDVGAYLEAIAPEPRVAVAIQARGEGELSQTVFGLAARVGEGRAIALEFLEQLRPLLEDDSRAKAGMDVKSTLAELFRCGVEARGFSDDPVLYAFLLNADPGACTPEALIERQLGRKAGGAVEELADFALELTEKLDPEVKLRGLRELYETIDLPLAPVLARMERTGIRIEPAALERLSGRMQNDISRLTGEIHELAGAPFNINSPQQLGKVLYEELKLPAPARSGKRKGLSTAADVLEGLAKEHPIAGLVLEYRQLAKLKGTYVDALPALIDPETERLHTTFNQTGAATGRLSSSNPNLQNIPVRTELGREIRAAFVPRPGWKLIVADYSQIELRLLAHMSRDPVLLDAFRRGEDIHTRTAAEVFEVPPLMVTPEQRRNAKTVNFGIIYGLSPFGLSNQLGIPRQEAELYIRSYFERYQGVRKFIDDMISRAREAGVTRTLFGRERPMPDINSSNPNARGFAERTAVNTPLQGTAADLIKLAMISIDRRIIDRDLQTRMLLQVHDELVFETPPAEVEVVAKMVKQEMENVHTLDVPLLVDIGIGDNWRDAK